MYFSVFLFHPSHGICFKRVVWPRMFRITSSEFFPYFKVCIRPKTSQIGRELNRLESRRKQFHQHRALIVIHTWCIRKSETFLQTDAHYRQFSTLSVINANPAARRHCNMAGCQSVRQLLLFVAQSVPHHFLHPNLTESRIPLCRQIHRQPFADISYQSSIFCIRQFDFRMPFSQALKSLLPNVSPVR